MLHFMSEHIAARTIAIKAHSDTRLDINHVLCKIDLAIHELESALGIDRYDEEERRDISRNLSWWEFIRQDVKEGHFSRAAYHAYKTIEDVWAY